MAKQRVLVDTCIIIEAFRTNCWKALCQYFSVETVERCVTECCSGDPLNAGYVPIAREELIASLAKVHEVTDTMLVTLAIEREGLPALDDGEHHLIAWLHAHPADAIVTSVSTTDRAAVRAVHVLQLLDRMRSLQDLGKAAGVDRRQLATLKQHFSEDWLSAVRMQLVMGVL
jgi:hypothetical protein